jgi:ferredoxin
VEKHVATQTLKVSIDPSRCVGYGRCAAVSPGLFMIDEDTNKAYFDEQEIETAKPRAIFDAARACPTQAITVEQFGRRVYPQILAPMASDIARQLAEMEAEDDDSSD